MSRKKHSSQSSKAELYEELQERLEELFRELESAEVHYSDTEHADYIDLVVRPFEDLISNVEVFATNISNDVYTIEDDLEDYNDD